MSYPERKMWIKTFGCQMNYHDSERMASFLANLNYKITENLQEANLVLFTTCAVRDLANKKFYSKLGEIKHLSQKQDLIVGIAGCVSQIEGQELLKKYKYLNFAIGTDVIDQINDVIFRIWEGEDKIFLNSWDKSQNYSIETKITHNNPQAFINIMKGCNNYCSYCIVPFTRGREHSRPILEIVDDVARLVSDKGVQEVTLLGQNVNSFGKERGETLSQLIMELEKIEDLRLIRYTTSHPYDLSDELIATHGISRKLSKHLHLPAQSGSNTVLERMSRRYTTEHFLGLMDKLKKANPEIVISSDIIVGFPNETDEEYQETIDFLNKAQFDFIYSYKFSPRAGTKAAKLKDSLSDEVRRERLVRLQKIQMDIQEKNRASLVGETLRVFVEGSKEKNGIKKWHGRSNCNRIVHFAPQGNQDYLWHWVDVKVEVSTALACQGKLITDYHKNPPV